MWRPREGRHSAPTSMKASHRPHIANAMNLGVRGVLIVAIILTVFVAYGLVGNAWYAVLAVRGGSMEPTISAGDLIVISRPPATIESGMVLTMQVDGAVVTHRVVEVRGENTFITQGDANDARDDFSANSLRIVGEYRFAVPLIGQLVDSLVSSGAWLTDIDEVSASAASGSWVVTSSSLDDGVLSLIWGESDWEESDWEESDAAPEAADTDLTTVVAPTPTVDPTPSVDPTPTLSPTPAPTTSADAATTTPAPTAGP